jgi:hypothetical protein
MRRIYEVQEQKPYEYGGDWREWESVKFFTERDGAELFAETYWTIYPDRETRVLPHDLLTTCPDVEVLYEAKAFRDAGGHIHFRSEVGKVAQWEDEPRVVHIGHYINQRGEAVGVGRTPEEARKQVAVVVEQWNQEQDEQLAAERKAALGNFLGMAGPMINEGL